MNPIEILSIGTKFPGSGGQLDFSAEDLGAIAHAFNMGGKTVPFVPGHPSEDDEAEELGRVTKLMAKDGKLYAIEYMDLNPTFVGIVNSGELNRISVKLRLPDHPENETGTYQLMHIGFLGRSDPADMNIGEAKFSKSKQEVTLMRGNNQNNSTDTGNPTDQKNQNVAATGTNGAANLAASPSPAVAEAEAELSAAISAQMAELKAQQAALDRRQEVMMAAEQITPFLDKLITEDHKILPCEKPWLVAMFSQLSGKEPLEITFSVEGEVKKVALLEQFKAFLSNLPKRVEYSELSASTDDDALLNSNPSMKAVQEGMEKVRNAYATAWKN